MSMFPQTIVPYISFLAPPLIGSFIGYLTNRVAIRMLFRPLKAWRILGIRLPMTPGVIPSKRHELAVNIGEMVGEHLLTSKEIGNALAKNSFQDHLYTLIEDRFGGILLKELGPPSTLIPDRYLNYYTIFVNRVIYLLHHNIHTFLQSSEFAGKVQDNIENRYMDFLLKDIDTIFTKESRRTSYDFIEKNLQKMLSSKTMEDWVEDYVRQKVQGVLRKGMSCEEILPDSLNTLIIHTIEQQTPALLVKFAAILKEPDIQDKIIGGVKEGVANFIESLGPMSNMVNSFISVELIEEKIREYLKEKEDDIVDWLQNEDVQQRVAKSIRERAIKYMQTPICNIIPKDQQGNVNSFCNTLSEQIFAMLREEATVSALSTMIRDQVEVYIHGGTLSIREMLIELAGAESVDTCRKWINEEVIQLLRSEESVKTIDALVESMVHSLLSRRVGRLASILPENIRAGMYRSIQKMSSTMLANEIPGVVDSLNLKHIVAEKVDSLDLLKLEGLLLSIMEEQFKYINLFGALLGFIIGCCNLIFLYGL